MSYDTGGMREFVLATLIDIAKSSEASASARATACRTIAEVLGMLKQAPKPSSQSAIEELSEGELDALIASRASASGVIDTVAPSPSVAVSEPKHVAGQRVKRPRAKRAPKR